MHDEILKLKQLLDQGVLTEEEFAAGKRKLLGMDGSIQQNKEATVPTPAPKPVPPPSKSGFAPAPYKEPSSPSYVSQAKSTKECPRCHEPIPQSAVVCPACGSSVSTINRSAKECPRCHRKYSASETGCPFCSNEKEQKTSSNQLRFITLIVVFVLAVCFINYLVKNSNDVKPKVSYTASQTSSIAAQSPTSTPKPVATTTPNPTVKPAANTSARTSASSYSSSKVSEDLKYALIDVTKKRVSNHLKAPSTAKFPSYKEWSVAKGEANVYNIIGYVDSQNSFGAMIRETVGAMIQYDGTYSSVVMIQVGDNIYLD